MKPSPSPCCAHHAAYEAGRPRSPGAGGTGRPRRSTPAQRLVPLPLRRCDSTVEPGSIGCRNVSKRCRGSAARAATTSATEAGRRAPSRPGAAEARAERDGQRRRPHRLPTASEEYERRRVALADRLGCLRLVDERLEARQVPDDDRPAGSGGEQRRDRRVAPRREAHEDHGADDRRERTSREEARNTTAAMAGIGATAAAATAPWRASRADRTSSGTASAHRIASPFQYSTG